MKKKFLITLLTLVCALCCVFGFAACGEGTTTPTPSGTESKHKGTLREGYVEQYDGLTGTVHWVKNEETGLEIYTRIFRSENFDENKKYPLLIMCHGYNDFSKNGNTTMVSNTVAQGIVCVTFDFCGGGSQSKSEGKTTNMSVLTEISDLEAVIAEMQGMSYIDTDKIGLFGQSFGGMVASVTAARHNDEVAALILQAPAIGAANRGGYTSKDEIPEVTTLNYMKVGKKFFLDAWDFDSWDEIGNYKKDVFIMYGTGDDMISRETIDRACEIYGEEHCTLLIVEGAPHGFSEPHYEKALDGINSFFVQTGLANNAA